MTLTSVFFPPDSGSYGADLIVLTATQRLVVRLTGQGKRPSVVFDTLIDLGQQIPGVRKDTIVRGIIRYFGNGSRRLEVNTRDSVIGLGSLPTAARLPLTIGSRDSASIAFRFTPQGAREYLDSLEVRDTSQAIVARIPVRGRGVCPALLANPIATSPAPQLVEYLPGDSLRIPIRLLTNIPAGVNIPFRVELRTDASVLWFNPEQYNLLPEGVSQRLIVEGQTGSPDTTLVLNAIVTLGRTDTIAIELLSLGFAQCELAQQSGAAISAVAICKAGGRRLFEPGLAAAMTSIRYVEAAQTVLVDGQLSESGSVQVALYDLMGRTQAQCTFEARPGVFRAELPTEPLSHGLYVVTMRTTTRVISGTLLR